VCGETTEAPPQPVGPEGTSYRRRAERRRTMVSQILNPRWTLYFLPLTIKQNPHFPLWQRNSNGKNLICWGLALRSLVSEDMVLTLQGFFGVVNHHLFTVFIYIIRQFVFIFVINSLTQMLRLNQILFHSLFLCHPGQIIWLACSTKTLWERQEKNERREYINTNDAYRISS
jgi:hypothetical protein